MKINKFEVILLKENKKRKNRNYKNLKKCGGEFNVCENQ